jgi:hypothetical protein
MEPIVTSVDVRALDESPDLIAIGALAEEERRRRHGVRATFVRVLHVQLGAAAPTRVPGGVREIRIGGRGSLDEAVAAVRGVTGVAGRVPVTGFDLAAICGMADAAGVSLREAAAALRQAGLAHVSEARVDRLGDLGRDAALAILETAHGGLPLARFTIDTVDPSNRLALLEQADALARALGPAAPRAFAPLPQALPDETAPSTGYDDVKLVALARVRVQRVASIQVDWRRHGPKLAQVALLFGADDLDNVAADEEGANLLGPRRAPLEEVLRNIRTASREPVERTGTFDLLER